MKGPLYTHTPLPMYVLCVTYYIKVSEGSIYYCFNFQNVVPQKGSEVNLTLGGIDLNNSGRLAFLFFFLFLVPS